MEDLPDDILHRILHASVIGDLKGPLAMPCVCTKWKTVWASQHPYKWALLAGYWADFRYRDKNSAKIRCQMGFSDEVGSYLTKHRESNTRVLRQMAVAVFQHDIESLHQLAKAAPRKYKPEELDVLFRAYLFRQQKDVVLFEHVCRAAESVCDAWPEYWEDLKRWGVCPVAEVLIDMPSNQATTGVRNTCTAQLAGAVVGALGVAVLLGVLLF